MKVSIEAVEYHLPSTILTNEQLGRENPSWEMNLVEARAGVVNRRIARQDETALDLGYEACLKIFSAGKFKREDVDALIFCTQSGDYIMPPNSCVLHKKLDLREDVFAFDYNLACSGYIYGLSIAQGLILSGMCRNVLLVTADTYSKYINKKDRSARVLFGDGAAASWLTASRSGAGILDIACATSGKDFEKFMIPAGGARIPRSQSTAEAQTDGSGNSRSLENIRMDGLGIYAFVNSKIPKHVSKLLEKNGLTADDIDLFIFHQASKMALDALAKGMNLKPEKVFTNIRDIGNTVSASIPIALKDALASGRAKKGDRIVLCGFGVGLSWGTAIVTL